MESVQKCIPCSGFLISLFWSFDFIENINKSLSCFISCIVYLESSQHSLSNVELIQINIPLISIKGINIETLGELYWINIFLS